MPGVCSPGYASAYTSMSWAFFLQRCLLKCYFIENLALRSTSIQNYSFEYSAFPFMIVLGVKTKASLIILALGDRKRVYNAARWYVSPLASFTPSSLISFVINPCSNLTHYGSTCVHQALAKWTKLYRWVWLSWFCRWHREWKKDVGFFWRAKNSYNLIRVEAV